MRRLTMVGLWLVGGGIALQVLSGAIAAGSGSSGDFAATAVLGSLGGTATFVGIIVLIVSAVRGRGQQQQQQIVIHMPPAAGVAAQGPQTVCVACRKATPSGRAFCGQCGARLAGVSARSPVAARAPARK